MTETFLKPLRPKKRPFKFAVMDIESNGWINFEMMGLYDGRIYRQFDSVDAFLDRVLTHRYRDFTFFAHNGGKFDFLFLLGPLEKRNIPYSTITQGARITAIKIKFRKRVIRFVDSYPIFQSSLKRLCETFAPDRAKLSGTIDFERERVDKRNPTHQAYLENDCFSLFQIISKYQKLPYVRECGVKLTTASLAMAAFRTTMKKKIRITDQVVQDFVRDSYAGGRVEIFRQIEREFDRYDVNSLFPAQMRMRAIPVECLGRSRDPLNFGFHDVTIEVPECHIPVLYHKIGGKLIFPTGIFRGKFFSEELKLAISQGARILEFHEGYLFSKSETLFSDFVNTLYKIREENPGNNPLNYLAKCMMNHSYGKWAEKEEKTTLIRVDPRDPETWPREFRPFKNERFFTRTGLCEVTDNRRPPHALCHIGAAITAWARVQMVENYYLPSGDSLIYTDTDSVDTRTKFQSSTKIGELKHEFPVVSGFYLLPKAYYLNLGNGKSVRKIKGFSSKALEKIDFDQFKSGKLKYSENKIATFRTSLIRNGVYLSMVDQKRSIVSEYDKRKMLPDGSTRPWEIKDGKLR